MPKINIAVYNLNIYRDGTLPAIQQDIHTSNLHILRCSYWAIQAWNHSNLSSPYWRLYWNREPGASITWADSTYPLQPDRLILITPNTPFRSHLNPGTKLQAETNVLIGMPCGEEGAEGPAGLTHHLFTHFTLGQPYDQIAPHVYKIPLHNEITRLINELADLLIANRHHFDHRHSFALQALIHYALERIPEPDWPEQQMDPRVLRILGFIDDHLNQSLTNEDFGQVAGMSPNAFTRLFREKTGMTPLVFLNQRRIEKASILLHHTDHSIEEIAEVCGFTDRYYFSRVFKKQIGVGPATYRKRRAA